MPWEFGIADCTEMATAAMRPTVNGRVLLTEIVAMASVARTIATSTAAAAVSYGASWLERRGVRLVLTVYLGLEKSHCLLHLSELVHQLLLCFSVLGGQVGHF
jgi:heme O synthase-like polyprenyltransferase